MFEHMWLKIGFVFIDTYTCWIAFYLRQLKEWSFCSHYWNSDYHVKYGSIAMLARHYTHLGLDLYLHFMHCNEIMVTIGWILMTFPLAPPAGWSFLSPWNIIIIFTIISRLAQKFVHTFMVTREWPPIWWSLKFPPGTTMRLLFAFWGEMSQRLLNKWNFVHMFMSPSGWSQYETFPQFGDWG